MNKGTHVGLYEYRYNGGKKPTHEFLQTAKPGEWVETMLYLDMDSKKLGWRLKSYHGGTEKATIKITVEYEYKIFTDVNAATAFMRLRELQANQQH